MSEAACRIPSRTSAERSGYSSIGRSDLKRKTFTPYRGRLYHLDAEEWVAAIRVEGGKVAPPTGNPRP